MIRAWAAPVSPLSNMLRYIYAISRFHRRVLVFPILAGMALFCSFSGKPKSPGSSRRDAPDVKLVASSCPEPYGLSVHVRLYVQHGTAHAQGFSKVVEGGIPSDRANP